jgi:hypothetical protein
MDSGKDYYISRGLYILITLVISLLLLVLVPWDIGSSFPIIPYAL